MNPSEIELVEVHNVPSSEDGTTCRVMNVLNITPSDKIFAGVTGFLTEANNYRDTYSYYVQARDPWEARLKLLLTSFKAVPKNCECLEIMEEETIASALDSYLDIWKENGWRKSGGDTPACVEIWKEIHQEQQRVPCVRTIRKRLWNQDQQDCFDGLCRNAEMIICDRAWPDERRAAQAKAKSKPPVKRTPRSRRSPSGGNR